jgi:phage terminase large subunit
MRAEFPEILQPLFEPKTNKVVYGGRGGLKSWGFASALVALGTQQYERVVCVRETMDSIGESVHHLLEQRIAAMGLQSQYEVQQRKIIGPYWPGYGHTEFVFGGLRYNVHNLKSLEGATKCWVEEAAKVSKHSWDTLLPTLRWEDKTLARSAELWVSFNPEQAKDETYRRWVLSPPPDTWRLKTTYRDNPWFPKVLRVQMEHAKRTDPEGYQHVWEGECSRGLAGAIYAGEFKMAVAEGRITSVPYDRRKPVHTYWDLGFGDRNCIWMAQECDDWWNFIDYIEGCGEPLSFYAIEMQRRNYVYGTCFLPHDGVDAMLHSKLSNDRSKSPDQVLRGLGFAVRIAPKLNITTGINSAREIFPRCRFDENKCASGLHGLENYQWGEAAANGQEKTKPLHDFASHPADAFRTFAVATSPDSGEEDERAPAPPPTAGRDSWMA